MTTEVRALGGDDWPLWRDLRLRALQDCPSAFASTYAREEAFDEQLWRGRLDDEGSLSLLAVEDGDPVAMAGGYPDRPGMLQVVAMWVAPPARGRRLAHAVLEVLEEWAGARGRRLHLQVNTGNAAAVRSYQRFGFVLTGEREPLRSGSDEVVERMVLHRR